MSLTALGAIAGVKSFVKSLPRELWIGVGVVILLGLIAGLSYCAGGNAETAGQERASREAMETARGADDVAGKAVAEEIDKTEMENENARNAASGSDDPLRDGLNSLRSDPES